MMLTLETTDQHYQLAQMAHANGFFPIRNMMPGPQKTEQTLSGLLDTQDVARRSYRPIWQSNYGK